MQNDSYYPRSLVTPERSAADNKTKHRPTVKHDENPELDHRLDSRRLLTVGQVSRLLSISKSMVYELIHAGTLRSINLGQRATRVTVQEIDRCVQDLLDREQQ